MKLPFFQDATSNRNEHYTTVYSLYELAYTAADFLAAMLFVTGSVLFFSEETKQSGTWLFLFGSLLFALKPSLRMAREIHLWRLGKTQTLARRAGFDV